MRTPRHYYYRITGVDEKVLASDVPVSVPAICFLPSIHIDKPI